jgi:membrane-associated phospholipid phosphatase
VAVIGGAGVAATLGGIAALDPAPLPAMEAASAHERLWSPVIDWMDLIAGKEISNFLLGGLLLLVGIGLKAMRRRAAAAGALLYVGGVQLAATVAADFAKPPFGRYRPFQAKAEGGADRWFMGPDFGSFPSGHTAFYAGLFFPLALLFPRWAAAFLAVPLLVAASRVASFDHYPSDVGASLALAAGLSLLLWKVMGLDPRRPVPG